jgi:hypothetical protein
LEEPGAVLFFYPRGSMSLRNADIYLPYCTAPKIILKLLYFLKEIMIVSIFPFNAFF